MNYKVKKYGAWWWIIIGPHDLAVYDKGKLLTFRSKEAAQEYIDTILTSDKNSIEESVEHVDDIKELCARYRCKLNIHFVEDNDLYKYILSNIQSIASDVSSRYGSKLKYWTITADKQVKVYLTDGSIEILPESMTEGWDADVAMNDLTDAIRAYLEAHGITDYVYSPYAGLVVISVERGDWRHDHIRLENLMNDFFEENSIYQLGYKSSAVTETDGSDVYSADHYYFVSTLDS